MASRKEIREQTRKTRQSLIEAALELSSEEGFASLSLRSVARKAGIAPTSFYRHFRDMDELGTELIDELVPVLQEYLEQIQIQLKEISVSEKIKESGYKNILFVIVKNFIECVNNHLSLIHLIFQIRTGSSEKLRKLVIQVTSKLSRNIEEHLQQHLTQNNQNFKNINFVSESILEFMVIGSFVLLNEKKDLEKITKQIIEKSHMLLLGALALEKNSQS
jgi:AcrR family transcriptional regulator